MKTAQRLMVESKYVLSFTAANLAVQQSLVIAHKFQETRDWQITKMQIQEHNLLQARTKSALIRLNRELIGRLQTLHASQIELLCSGSPEEQRQVLWLAVCKRYAFIREFAVEVIHEKFARGDLYLTDFDYISFYNSKADWHPELETITESTRKKVRSTMLFMLRQAHLTTPRGEIIPAIFSPQARQALDLDAPMSYLIFPAPYSVPQEAA